MSIDRDQAPYIDENEFFDSYSKVPLTKNGVRFTLAGALASREFFCPPGPDETPLDRIVWMAQTLFDNGKLEPVHHFLVASMPEEA